MSKLGEEVDALAQGIWEHVRIGPKLSGIAKGKLRLGARILQAGGVKKVFKRNFSVRQEEKLMKVSQCYLSTTAGPIAGLLFISTDKVAFCSDRSIKLSSPTGEFVKVQYKITDRRLDRSLLIMKNVLLHNAIGIPFSSAKQLLPDPKFQHHNPPNGSKLKHNRVDSESTRTDKHGKRAESFALRIREHVRLGPKLTETVKGKLSLGAKILQLGGVARVFKQNFNVKAGEKLINASQCYLSTTAGPIAGLLFTSTDKVAFLSERSIKLSSPTGELVRVHYKVLIPIMKIERANERKNVERPSLKYIQIVTADNFDFWFMGFLNHQRTLMYLQNAISQTQ
ncbi:hypothetical protein RJ639_009226 [Escallonia herrerae]|uniref:GRAM domain-containing protein n=1 Tax=Escallonia herrerae TaxID=1293975 RepID=A0AA88VP98_9ASTE|nr:hypothetical protein RJ639_009226 [Escallonia herrerae]